MQPLLPTSKNYYFELGKEEINKIKAQNIRPKLLLHACCAVCACYPLIELNTIFDVTILYSNSNIYPFEEYEIRKNELVHYLESFYPNIPIIIPEYDHETYMKPLEPLKDVPEGGTRCFACYAKRMEDAFIYATEHNFDYVCTILTVSRQKNSRKINEIAEKLQKKYPNVKYFFSDFKKQDGYNKGQKIANNLGMYKQQYCGCEYSIRKEKTE